MIQAGELLCDVNRSYDSMAFELQHETNRRLHGRDMSAVNYVLI